MKLINAINSPKIILNQKDLLTALIRKDLTFNLKYILLLFFLSFSLIYTIAGGHRFGQDISLFLFAALPFSSVIIKMTYIEDSYSSDTFLKALPVSKKVIVMEKFILSQILLVIGIVQNSLIYFFLPQIAFSLSFSEGLLMITYIEMYFGLYLYIFFRFNYSMAYIIPCLFLGGLYGLYFSGNSVHTFKLHPVLSVLLFALSLLVNCLLTHLSIKQF